MFVLDQVAVELMEFFHQMKPSQWECESREKFRKYLERIIQASYPSKIL